jgi:hypothetical protein
MKRTNIKDGFGGEVAFTKFIANNPDTSARLLNALDLSYEDGYKVTPEEHTSHSKRVDLVIRDSDDEIVLCVESQDASGWLDAIHASKITYYMYDKKCDDGVLICEDADEHIKGYVKWVNENTPLRVTLVSVVIFQSAKEMHCEFIPLIRPTQLADKKVVRKSATVNEIDQNKADHLQQLFNDHNGLFTNVTGRYCSKNNVGNTGMNVGIVPYKSEGYYVDIWHAGKFDTPEFRKTFTDVCVKHGMEAKFQKSRAYVNGDKVLATSDAVDAFKIFVAALEHKEIYA